MFTKEGLEAMPLDDLALAATAAGVKGSAAKDRAGVIEKIMVLQTQALTESAKELPNHPELRDPDDASEKGVQRAPKVKIIVHNQEGVEATAFVKVQVNGVMFAIPREQAVVVPQPVVEALRNAVKTEHIPGDDGRGNVVLVERETRRFPFTVLE
jgi:hypothetical protein